MHLLLLGGTFRCPVCSQGKGQVPASLRDTLALQAWRWVGVLPLLVWNLCPVHVPGQGDWGSWPCAHLSPFLDCAWGLGGRGDPPDLVAALVKNAASAAQSWRKRETLVACPSPGKPTASARLLEGRAAWVLGCTELPCRWSRRRAGHGAGAANSSCDLVDVLG